MAEELDRYDPDGRALVLVAPFLATARAGDRMVYGARRPEWVALEDKARDHLLLDAAGVAHPDFLLAPPERDVLTGAAARLDRGEGTVWAGDAREGVNGAGEYVRWIREAHVDDTHEAVTFFRAGCDRVRIAPFVEGLPCSIHGLVTDDGVAVFRPVELVMLRPSAGARFRYAGAGTFWDPAPVDGEAMRGAPRRVGNVLRERVGLRGVFGIDGILGEDGFVATELNPRFAAGLGYVMAALPELAFDCCTGWWRQGTATRSWPPTSTRWSSTPPMGAAGVRVGRPRGGPGLGPATTAWSRSAMATGRPPTRRRQTPSCATAPAQPVGSCG